MIIKATGRTVGTMSHLISYLGTVGDKTPAHQNPGKTAYLKAKSAGDTKDMNKYRVYLRRDLMTWGNFDTSSKTTISTEVQNFMSKNRRKIQSREFVLMPSDSDHIDPNNPCSVRHFVRFTQIFINHHFNNNFHYYVCVQPDSHQHAKVHAHIVVINDTLSNGHAMAGKYYDVRHLRHDLRDTAKFYNVRYHDYSFQPVKSNLLEVHQPDKLEKLIISASQNAIHNPAVTSRLKFIAYLAKHHVKAAYRKGHQRIYHTHIVLGNKRKAIKHVRQIKSGWKYKYVGDNNRHAYIKGSRISKATGGSFLSADNVKQMLSTNRKLKARRGQQATQKERINDERKRFSKRYSKRIEEIRRNANKAEPTPRPVFSVNTRPSSQGGSDTRAGQQSISEVESERSRQERQSNASILTSVLTRFNKTCQRLKRFNIKAKALRLKRRIAKAIAKRIEEIRMNVILRIHQRQHQRQQKQEAERRWKRRRRWEREHGGPDFE